MLWTVKTNKHKLMFPVLKKLLLKRRDARNSGSRKKKRERELESGFCAVRVIRKEEIKDMRGEWVQYI